MSMDQQTENVSAKNFLGDHGLAFSRTLRNIYSTSNAERTFAQIIDGLPTRDDVGFFLTYSIEIRDNIVSSTEAMEAARRVRGYFDTYTTSVDAKLAQAYQNSLPSSREFYMRLLEMLAVACHNIAGTVYLNTQPGLRRQGQIHEQRLAALEGRPTDFMHEDYHDLEQYPKCVANVVGYWAEYHLFGGVVLFDRGETGTDCKRAFLHPVGSFRIFEISEPQMQTFINYVEQLLVGVRDLQPPFPLSAEKYTLRVGPFDSMSLNIYRDKYERITPKERPERCVQRLEDFPELQDAIVRVNCADSTQ